MILLEQHNKFVSAAPEAMSDVLEIVASDRGSAHASA
jgi:hypothetical protein